MNEPPDSVLAVEPEQTYGEAAPGSGSGSAGETPLGSASARPRVSPRDLSGSVWADAAAVDAHVHIFPEEIIERREAYVERDRWFEHLYRSPDARMATAEEVVNHMDGVGVEVSIVFGFAFRDQGLCRMVNDYVIESVRRYPGRLAGLACVSPEASGATAELERCLDLGLKGCGELMPDGQGFGAMWCSNTSHTAAGLGQAGATPANGFTGLAQCLQERGAPLLLHSNEPVGHDYAGKGDFTPEACFAFAKAFPDLTVVFAHMGGGLFLYELMSEVRAALTNVHYDTSAVPYLYRPEIYEVAVTCAGAGKLLFGSDFPLLSPGRYRDGLARLAPADRSGVLVDNARRVFSL